ncbi:MAG: hypothetical protein HC841_04865 [Verrucomicrobiae bacterium]|nr:hypothetical protein [Verrucomicrobiae bacterium]
MISLQAAATKASESEQYRSPDGIVRFVREVLRADPAPYQEDILRNFVLHKRAAVRGPHGLGKTALSSWIILWGASCCGDDVKVVTTASAWRQLTHYTWPEVRKWAARAMWELLGLRMRRDHEILEYGIKLPGREAFAVASNDPALIEGAHAKTLLYVLDESKSIPDPFWDAIEGAFSGAGSDTEADAFALAISTAGAPSGRFYDIHKRKRGYEEWWVRHVTLEEAVAAGRVSREWADGRKAQWGESSPVYQNRVLGNFAESGTDSVIPLAWIDQAVERWHERGGKGEGKESWGQDVAYTGDDDSVLACLVGSTFTELRVTSLEDPMQTAGRAIAALRQNMDIPIAVDVIGVGAGTYARLAEQGYQAIACNVAEATDLKDRSGELRFINLRAALWWALREALDPANGEDVALPPDDLLIGELTAPRWTYTSAGKIKIEAKDDIRKRLGRSTDRADAIALAWYAGRLANIRKWRIGLW